MTNPNRDFLMRFASADETHTPQPPPKKNVKNEKIWTALSEAETFMKRRGGADSEDPAGNVSVLATSARHTGTRRAR